MKPILSKNEIENEFQNYLDALFEKEFTKSLEYLEEDLFLYISRTEMLQYLETYYNNPDLSIALQGGEILEIGDIKKIGDKYYSLIDYKLILHLILKPDVNETIEEFQQRTEAIKSSFEEIFGIDHLEYVKELDFFRATSIERAVAINKSETFSWRFLVYEEEELVLMNKLIPEIIMQELNHHLNN